MLSSRPFHNTTAQIEIPISINSFTEVVTAFINALVRTHSNHYQKSNSSGFLLQTSSPFLLFKVTKLSF